jgi:hypothetical protein
MLGAQEKPKRTLVPDTYKPPTGIEYRVTDGDSWESLARAKGMDPWDLIDFNFPDMKEMRQIDPQRAARNVNWYLAEYVGCTALALPHRQNLMFSSNLTGGRGVHKGGRIFLPPAPAPALAPPPPPVAGCAVIEIPASAMFPVLHFALKAVGAQLPNQARCLDPTEIEAAKNVYGYSLTYDDIYVSDAVGFDNRPFTIALPLLNRWIVVLNLGSGPFNTPNLKPSTLIHELAHAWQSQHHPDAWKFMANSMESQAAASVASHTLGVATNPWITGTILLGGGGADDVDADAYSYVPGLLFGDYGAEQAAQQVEDYNFPPSTLSSTARTQIKAIMDHMRSVPPSVNDAENVRGLDSPKFVFKDTPDVVWHD